MYNIPMYPGYKLTKDYKIIGKEGGFLTMSKTQKGHQYCNVFVEKAKLLYLHRAIALVHVDGYFDGAWVDHIDDNPLNNDPLNLQWVLPRNNNYNVKYSSNDIKYFTLNKIKMLKRKIEIYQKRMKMLQDMIDTLELH
jgi:hypothetical protein